MNRLMSRKEESEKNKGGFLQDSLKVLIELLGKLLKKLWEYFIKLLKYIKKEYL